MAEPNKPPRWFCRNSSTGDVQGPFDLLELAGLLRSGDITGETLTQAEGDESWVAFQDRLEWHQLKRTLNSESCIPIWPFFVLDDVKKDCSTPISRGQ